MNISLLAMNSYLVSFSTSPPRFGSSWRCTVSRGLAPPCIANHLTVRGVLLHSAAFAHRYRERAHDRTAVRTWGRRAARVHAAAALPIPSERIQRDGGLTCHPASARGGRARSSIR